MNPEITDPIKYARETVGNDPFSAFLGIVIGGIVIAMFLPVFKLTELVAH